MSNAVAERPNSKELIEIVKDKQATIDKRLTSMADLVNLFGPRIFQALPKGVTADRIARTFLFAVRKNLSLLNCNPPSLLQAVAEAATYGWEVGGILGHAYLVPFKEECVLIPGYKGLIDLARRSGQVSTVDMQAVHDGDTFEYSLGDDPRIDHQPDDRNPKRTSKPITYVYAVVKLRDGGVQRSVWSREKIEAHKERYSKNWKSPDSAWQTSWEAMAKKTVIRGMINSGLVPMSAEYRDIASRDEGEPIIANTPIIDFNTVDSPAITGPSATTVTEADIVAELAAVELQLDVQQIKQRFKGAIADDRLDQICDDRIAAIKGGRGERAKK